MPGELSDGGVLIPRPVSTLGNDEALVSEGAEWLYSEFESNEPPREGRVPTEVLVGYDCGICGSGKRSLVSNER